MEDFFMANEYEGKKCKTGECYQCAYYGVDANYNGFCKADHDKYVDRYKKACDKFKAK